MLGGQILEDDLDQGTDPSRQGVIRGRNDVEDIGDENDDRPVKRRRVSGLVVSKASTSLCHSNTDTPTYQREFDEPELLLEGLTAALTEGDRFPEYAFPATYEALSSKASLEERLGEARREPTRESRSEILSNDNGNEQGPVVRVHVLLHACMY